MPYKTRWAFSIELILAIIQYGSICALTDMSIPHLQVYNITDFKTALNERTNRGINHLKVDRHRANSILAFLTV